MSMTMKEKRDAGRARQARQVCLVIGTNQSTRTSEL